ncbi:MAG: hypothetical protein ACRCXB_26205 [Aeromonadaceae bacterium]
MSNNAMSNETDLDWLARNHHTWPSKADKVVSIGWKYMKAGEPNYVRVFLGKEITKDQWLARRAELQNKPSWKDAPEWAEWLAQDKHGDWWWHNETTKTRISEFDSVGAKESNTGEVLGDWRDTLERRPIDLFEPAGGVKARGDDDAEIVERDAAVCGGEGYLNNHWFERGELPPVGTVCEYALGANAPWYQCEIKYVILGDGVVMKRIPCGTEQYCSLYSKQPVSFRPIRTERELAIADMIAISGLRARDGVKEIMSNLYDAGYRKDPK